MTSKTLQQMANFEFLGIHRVSDGVRHISDALKKIFSDKAKLNDPSKIIVIQRDIHEKGFSEVSFLKKRTNGQQRLKSISVPDDELNALLMKAGKDDFTDVSNKGDGSYLVNSGKFSSVAYNLCNAYRNRPLRELVPTFTTEHDVQPQFGLNVDMFAIKGCKESTPPGLVDWKEITVKDGEGETLTIRVNPKFFDPDTIQNLEMFTLTVRGRDVDFEKVNTPKP